MHIRLTAIITGMLLAVLGTAASAAPHTTPVTGQDTTSASTATGTVYRQLEGLPEAPSSLAVDTARVSQAVVTPIAFTTVGFSRPLRFRTSVDGRTWTDWRHSQPVDGSPDHHHHPDEAEHADTGAATTTAPIWVGEARHLQVAVDGISPREVDVHLIDAAGLSRSSAQRAFTRLDTSASPAQTVVASSASGPDLDYVSRAQWGADESLRRGEPDYADDVRYGVVHHTVSANDYTRAETPAMIRGMYRYHTQVLGWDDIGYNLLVDRFGTVYEGRAGGVGRAVIGAHAGGFNTGSFGVSMIGTYTERAPSSAALEAVTDVVSWKFRKHGIDPTDRIKVTSGGGTRHPSGTTITIDTLIGHRDVSTTACPGREAYALMDELRPLVAARMGGGVGENAGDGDGSHDTPQQEPTVSFRDVDGSAHESSITRLAADRVTTGCAPNRFCPDRAVTRGQMASFLVRAFDHLAPVDGDRFSDVPDDSPHAAAINGIVAAGTASGYADGTFRPDQPLSRAHMAVFLQRALELDLVWGFPFDDLPRDDVTVRPRVNALAAAGITQGCRPDHYCPNVAVSRAQMATFLVRAIADDAS